MSCVGVGARGSAHAPLARTAAVCAAVCAAIAAAAAAARSGAASTVIGVPPLAFRAITALTLPHLPRSVAIAVATGLGAVHIACSALRVWERRAGSGAIVMATTCITLLSLPIVTIAGVPAPLAAITAWSWIIPSVLFVHRRVPTNTNNNNNNSNYKLSLILALLVLGLPSSFYRFSLRDTIIPPICVMCSSLIADYLFVYRRVLAATKSPQQRSILDRISLFDPLTDTFLTRNFLVDTILYRSFLLPVFLASTNTSDIVPHDLLTRDKLIREQHQLQTRRNAAAMQRHLTATQHNIARTQQQQQPRRPLPPTPQQQNGGRGGNVEIVDPNIAMNALLQQLHARAMAEDDPETAAMLGNNLQTGFDVDDINDDSETTTTTTFEPDASTVEQLVAMGFEEEASRAALRRSGGNIEAAIGALI